MDLDDRLNKIGKLYADLNEGHLLGTREAKLFLVGMGTLMAGAGQLIADPHTGTPWNRVVGIIGIVLAFVGGWWTIRAEKHAPQALEEGRKAAQEAMKVKAEAEALRREVKSAFENMRHAHRHQRQLLALSKLTTELAQHLNRSTLTLEERLEKLLQLNERQILAGMRVDGGERWTLSIYMPNGNDLERVAAACADRTTSKTTGRPWKIGEGFVGAAYQRKGDLVLADAQAPQIQAMLNVPTPSPSDAARYRSVAALPVRVDGMPDPPWGIVIGTSDKKGRFDDDAKSAGAANAEAIRIFANAVALVVSGVHIADAEIAPAKAPATKGPRSNGAAKNSRLAKNG